MREEEEKLSLYDSISGNRIQLAVENNRINWYICGPTVYDSPHLGHARTYIVFDTIRSVLERYFHYELVYTMNITDIDDKIIKRAEEQLGTGENIHDKIAEITRKYTKEFFDCLELLNVRHPTYVVRVSDFIGEIEAFIFVLLEKGYAYESRGSYYFDVAAYNTTFGATKYKYPMFSKDNQCDFEDKSDRVKRSNMDFCLWKGRTEEPYYQSKFGTGRPGWHIECSAMANNLFPDGLDIHSGGIDLCFPHHENEIAQSQAFGGLEKAPWVKCFLHSGHLHIDGLKMSKSLKNFITIQDFLQKFTPRQVRLSFLLTKWNEFMDYSPLFMEEVISVESRLSVFISKLESSGVEFKMMTPADQVITEQFDAVRKGVHKALADNINTPLVFKLLLEFTGVVYKSTATHYVCKQIAEYYRNILSILGVEFKAQVEGGCADKVANLLCKFRQTMRTLLKEKAGPKEFYTACDTVRENLSELGYIIEDSKAGSELRKLN